MGSAEHALHTHTPAPVLNMEIVERALVLGIESAEHALHPTPCPVLDLESTEYTQVLGMESVQHALPLCWGAGQGECIACPAPLESVVSSSHSL